MQIENNDNDLPSIIAQAIEEMKLEQGKSFDIGKINLAELGRRTKISRSRLRRLQKTGFIAGTHALTNRRSAQHVLAGYEGIINDMLQKGISNSSVCYERIQDHGYAGGLTTVKVYIQEHKHLLPPKRQAVPLQGNRGRRYGTAPGESYQMDWGFVSVDDGSGKSYRIACFAMICHHCGERFVEFFPNARQESLFIGMLHAFAYMGIPRAVLTDNMRSVVTGRDPEGHPIWQKDYEQFMKAVHFTTKLCRPRHPFTKGKVERLIRFVKDNFLAGRVFREITDLNYEAVNWCNKQNNTYHKAIDCIPEEVHSEKCLPVASQLIQTKDILFYLCPERLITFDGFINFEGRRFGVPFSYNRRSCRIYRKEYTLYIYDDELANVLAEHDVTWSRHGSFCHGQYTDMRPEELPTMPVTAVITQKKHSEESPSPFDKFDFGKEAHWDEG